MDNSAHIYIDLDDVLCETAQKLVYVAAREFGRTTVFDQLSSFNVGISFDLTSEQVDHTMRLMHEPEMLLSVDPIPGAGNVLDRWAAAGFVIEIVTGRPPSTEDASHAWLKKHAIPYSDLVFVNKYGREHPYSDNTNYIPLGELRKREYRLAIDDSPEMVVFLASEMNTDVILFDRPWNSGIAVPAGRPNRRVERCRDWQDIAAKFVMGIESS